MPQTEAVKHCVMQVNLFTNQTDPGAFEVHDLGDGWIREYPQFLNSEQSAELMKTLVQAIPWQQDTIRIAGRRIPVPRLQCWMGETNYSYSGLRLQANPWQPAVTALRRRIEAVTGHEINSVLLNYYRNGQDSVSWHADDEPELGPGPVIASLSLGAERPFRLRQKHQNPARKHRILLQDGALLIMGETIQNNWLHEVPKVKGLHTPRINLTFRRLIS